MQGLRTIALHRQLTRPITSFHPISLRHSSTISAKEVGQSGTPEYRVFFARGDTPISPLHDIPLRIGSLYNMVVEIPRGTRAKLEISKEEKLNPIKQDVKKGKLRYVAWNYPFNYGALPQTWEDPSHVHPATKAKGDDDPVDVVDLSEATGSTGEVKTVKVLGTYAMIDDGETDWKMIVIGASDPKASVIHGLEDVEKHLPGKLQEVFTFLRDYKTPDGKPQNEFAFEGQPQDKDFAERIIQETHEDWKKLASDTTFSKIWRR
ncbi:inorganic pyrophosphatase [Planoprotostelium fungivorum]|uniref:inorganic diphosphatase n=1 Tax=Planoprotostelium fungivorum TaxID=1890364 RepID=A0A2P6NKJ4_9EUKA|nr:inorganic pyrophosphatase [Planoprotostelium fungivorum]